MKKNVKNIAYIQNKGILSNEQIKKYMGDIKYLTSDDSNIIYKFIVCCNKCYKITKFCLMINSEILKDLNLLIQKNRKLDKCIFFATYSSANSVRDVIAKNIYFSLSSLSVILNGFTNIATGNVMTIVSDANTPYYNQIYNTGPKPAYRISQLTVEKVNEFVDSGNAIDMLIALDDFAILTKILLDPTCKYKNFATFIDLASFNNPFIEKLSKKLARINTISSNVSLVGLTNAYPDLSSTLLYTNSAIQFVNFYKQWDKFIERAIVFNRFTKIYKNNKLATKAAEIINSRNREYSANISSISAYNPVTSGEFYAVALTDSYGIAGTGSLSSAYQNGLFYSLNDSPYYTLGYNWTQSDTSNTTVSTGSGEFSAIALSSSNGILYGIAAPNFYNYFTNTGGGIWYTTNSGETWQQSSDNNNNYFISVALSGSNGIAGSGETSLGIWYTTNSGETWQQSYYDNSGDNLTGNFSSIAMALNYNNIGIAGSNEDYGIWYTNTIGTSNYWSQSNITTGSFNNIGSLSLDPTGQYGAACSSASNIGILYTQDFGQNWYSSNISTNYFQTVVLSSSSAFGIAGNNTGNGTGLYYTPDYTNANGTGSGVIWFQSNITTGNFFSVALSGTNGIAGSFAVYPADPDVPAATGLYYSQDSGVTWYQSNINTGCFYCVALSGSNGIAGGCSSNGLYYTTDGGVNWYQSI